MTKVTVTVGEDGYMKIETDGHAQSVVCASVSTLLQSSVRFLQELSQQYPDDLQVTIKQRTD
ncbi:ribosomal-processing cysteine protease Prp [Bacillus sp. ISL-45]|uniref:ribosomal-processing cysteine protease Prp n=1 Tax=Bacillus sp. ISL-45 TaxID=2819128 RepID=UPI001BEC8891|nr:ribosomal-processing cysteine protease Prp [Bacillus sp. ISL-45]MBT2661939.1 ribosomal-processing cysteine protease Prp [Bacillus sp. ISL-45]